jgi:biotin carboxyl carrier protein
MTVFARLKLLIGILAVTGAVGLLSKHVDSQISTVTDASASLDSQHYAVGTTYAGDVVGRYVQAGEHVQEGQRLFAIHSSALARDVKSGIGASSTAPYRVRGGDTLIVTAPTGGTVSKVNVIRGAFVTSGQVLAEVDVRRTTYVRADFSLTPTQYARMREAQTVSVTLPNHQIVRTRISQTTVRTVDGTALTTVVAQSQQLRRSDLFARGTPVRAQVRLDEEGLLPSVSRALSGLLTPGSGT